MSYASEVLSEASLVLYWRLGESSGTNADDATANNRDGTYEAVGTGAVPTLGQASLVASDTSNTAADFERVDASNGSRVRRADEAALDVTNVTLECLIKPESQPGSGAFWTIASKTNASASTFVYGFDYRNAGGTMQFAIGVNTGTFTERVVTQTFANATVYHVVGTYDGANLRTYVNGAEVGTGTAKTGNISNVTDPLTVGTFFTVDPFDGVIDEFALYSAALSAARITAHYDASLTIPQRLRPDADTDAASWGTTPLWSKLNDESDATVVSDTLA